MTDSLGEFELFEEISLNDIIEQFISCKNVNGSSENIDTKTSVDLDGSFIVDNYCVREDGCENSENDKSKNETTNNNVNDNKICTENTENHDKATENNIIEKDNNSDISDSERATENIESFNENAKSNYKIDNLNIECVTDVVDKVECDDRNEFKTLLTSDILKEASGTLLDNVYQIINEVIDRAVNISEKQTINETNLFNVPEVTNSNKSSVIFECAFCKSSVSRCESDFNNVATNGNKHGQISDFCLNISKNNWSEVVCGEIHTSDSGITNNIYIRNLGTNASETITSNQTVKKRNNISCVNGYGRVLKIRNKCSSGHGNSGYDSFNDIDRTSGGSQYIPRIRSVQSCDNVAEQEKKTKKRRRRRPADETSGYSTTSLSELSEFESPRRKNHNNRNKRRESIQDDRSDKSRQSRLSNITSKSDISKVPSSRKISETSRGTTSPRESVGNLQRPLSALSIAESVRSEASLHSGRSNHTNKSRQTNRTSASTLPHKGSRLSINTDPSVDPFYFIQPVPETFSSKVRKSMGPIFGIFVMIILAASLGAAIYFAVELKKTHEDEIEMLRANLNLKITNARFSDDLNLDELSPTDFNSLSLKYCQQMDRFYKRSENFKNTYRGCEVISIRNENINFTLFFVDKGEKATQRDIISVIKTSAPKVQESGKSIALVDKFEIELDNVKIKIEHKREPASFNRIIEQETVPPPVKAPPQVRTTTESTTFETSVKMSENTTTTKAPTTVTVKTTTTTTTTRKPTTTTTKRPQPLVNQQESLKAWEPCGQLDGTFFQHPIECNKYFQCEHKKSLLQTCTGDLVFDNRSNVCVPHRPGVICPDPKLAPPKPMSTTTTATTTAALTTKPSVSNSKNRSTIPNYPSRPVYAREPCAKGKVGSLYPHPDDCSKFIQCITGGTGVISTCAGDLVYDPEQQTCVYQRNELVCPDIIPCKNMERGYFPHPFNCSLYIQCQSGKEIVQKCANGLVWDPSVNGCMFKTVSSVCPEDFS